MSHILNFSKKNLTKNISGIFEVLSENLIDQFGRNDSVINPEVHLILKNPTDREIVNNAVQEMKNDREIENKTVTLSNKKIITLTID